MSNFIDKLMIKRFRNFALERCRPHYNWLLDHPEVVDALSRRTRLSDAEKGDLYRFLREERRYELAALCLYSFLPAFPECEAWELIPKPAEEGDEQDVIRAWTGFVTEVYRQLSTDGLQTLLWIANTPRAAARFSSRVVLTDREAGNLFYETLDAQLYQLTALAICIVDGQNWL